MRLAKEEFLEFEGTVVDVLPDGRFKVRLDNEHEVLAYTAGRMKKNRIRTLAGDRVTVEMTPYDLEKGRITFRHKTGAARSRAARSPCRANAPGPTSRSMSARIFAMIRSRGSIRARGRAPRPRRRPISR